MIKFSNFGKAIVGSAPSGTTGLSFTVEAGKGLLFPALSSGDYFYGTFKDASGNREIVKVEARSSDAMTIAVGGRGLDGTTARTWAAGDYFVAGLTNIATLETFGNANLTAIGTLTTAADKLPYFTGAGAAATTTITAAARALIDDADTSAMLTTLGFSPYAKTLLSVTEAPLFAASSSVSQSVTSGVATKVTLGTEIFDTAGGFASSRWTPNVAGYYLLIGMVNGQASNLTGVQATIYKNGVSERVSHTNLSAATSTSVKCLVFTLVQANGTSDYFELYGIVNGSTLPIFPFVEASNASYFAGMMIRPT